jgi:hypothetical protein
MKTIASLGMKIFVNINERIEKIELIIEMMAI